MKIGISVCSAYRQPGGREGAQHMLERTRAANAAGLDSLFVGDHHATRGPYYQNVPMLGRLLAEWGDRPAGALFLLPLWNPVLVAEQMATLACLHEGRLILQCGLGGDPQQFAAMGADIRTRPSSFVEALRIIRGLWAGETVSGDRRFAVQDASIQPLPPEPIDVWIGASAPVAIQRAALLGDAWLADPRMPLEEATDALDLYRAACARHGRSPETVVIRRDVHIASTRRQARADVAGYLQRGYRGIDTEALVIGDIGSVTDELGALGAAGYDHVLIRNIAQEQSLALGTIERLAEVRSHLA